MCSQRHLFKQILLFYCIKLLKVLLSQIHTGTSSNMVDCSCQASAIHQPLCVCAQPLCAQTLCSQLLCAQLHTTLT